MSSDVERGDRVPEPKHKPRTAWQVEDALNRLCHCINVDESRLRQSLDTRFGRSGAYSRLVETHPHLLAKVPIFVAREHVEQMARIIESIENVVGMQTYRELVLDWAPEIGRTPYGPRGAFFGFDFHMTNDGPRLIEINTNAGGALLVLHIAAAQQACCREVEGFVVGNVDLNRLEREWVSMFRRELHLQFPGRDLRRVAIVDEKPAAQFLGPEFALFQQMFAEQGIEAIVAGPEELALRRGRLYADGGAVDLVYNRLTDFYLQTPASEVLNRAYREEAVAVTPGPYAHALYANKRNLAVLSDPDALTGLGVATADADVLVGGIPRSVMVSAANAESLWRDRRQYFFKPVWGFGSRGTYRGAKLTRGKWQEILESDYIAQQLVSPSERLLIIDGDQQAMKLDVRCYVYGGIIQLLGARMYRGQTTNFRTGGGGLAAVFTTSGDTG